MDPSEIRTRPAPKCLVCGTAGEVLYPFLRDRSFAAPGEWNLRRCPLPPCGLIWLDPRPVPEDIGKACAPDHGQTRPAPGASLIRDSVHAVWNSYLRVRFGYRHGTGPEWRTVFAPLALLHPGGLDGLDSAAMYLPAPHGAARVLDVGCGSGARLARMKSLGWDAEGVEMAPGGVAAACALGTMVHLGRLADAQFPDNHFDAVHSAHGIEHADDPVALLRECFRILKPGGRLVVITPNTQSWGHRLFGRAWVNLDPPRHLFLFNSRTLRVAAEKQGFTIERLNSTVRRAWIHGVGSRRIHRTGRAAMSQLDRPVSLVYGSLFQLRERARRWFDREAGEELLLIARKPGA